jgi:hypothetical protein
VCEIEEDALLEPCRRLVAAGVLVERAGGFAFRHALTREAIQAGLLSLDRHRIHAQAVRSLEAAGETCSARLATHALAAGDTERLVAGLKMAHTLLQSAALKPYVGEPMEPWTGQADDQAG